MADNNLIREQAGGAVRCERLKGTRRQGDVVRRHLSV
jgi:hypothetical protein